MDIKSSKSHAERLIDLNARMLLKKLPSGHNLVVDANGRFKEKHDGVNPNQQKEFARFQSNISVAHVNVCGWTINNHDLRCGIIDIISINESHLIGQNEITVNGYKWIEKGYIFECKKGQEV